jgi:hypothetical protein
MTDLTQAIEAALKHTEEAYQLSRIQNSYACEDLHDARESLKCAQLTEAINAKRKEQHEPVA